MHRQATGRQILQGSLIAAMHPRRTALAIWTASILGSQAHKHCDTFLRRNELLNLFMIPQHVEMQAVLPDNDEESVLLKLISHEPCHVDELIRGSGLATTTVSSTLMMMELKGMIKQVGGMQYVLRGRERQCIISANSRRSVS